MADPAATMLTIDLPNTSLYVGGCYYVPRVDGAELGSFPNTTSRLMASNRLTAIHPNCFARDVREISGKRDDYARDILRVPDATNDGL